MRGARDGWDIRDTKGSMGDPNCDWLRHEISLCNWSKWEFAKCLTLTGMATDRGTTLLTTLISDTHSPTNRPPTALRLLNRHQDTWMIGSMDQSFQTKTNEL